MYVIWLYATRLQKKTSMEIIQFIEIFSTEIPTSWRNLWIFIKHASVQQQSKLFLAVHILLRIVFPGYLWRPKKTWHAIGKTGGEMLQMQHPMIKSLNASSMQKVNNIFIFICTDYREHSWRTTYKERYGVVLT